MIENEISINGKFVMRVNFNLKGIGGNKSQIWLTTTIDGERARIYTGLLIEPDSWTRTSRTEVGERAIENSSLGKIQNEKNQKINVELRKILGYCQEYGVKVSQNHLMTNSSMKHSKGNFDEFLKSKIKFLQRQKLKYLKVGERWDIQGKDWIPVELSHYYDTDPNYRNKYIPTSDVIEELAVKFENQERYKNGRVLLSLSTSRKYRYLNTSLQLFTRSKYHRDFMKYQFRDLTEKFLQDFVVWVQIKAAKNGNTGDVSGKLRKLKAVCLYAKEQGVYNVNLNVFGSFKEKLKPRITTPKGIATEVMSQIEAFDRTQLTKKEQLYLDLFLFSYYAGGMSAIDVCLLTRNQIKDDLIIYDRTKYDKQMRVIIIDKAAEIIERYRSEAYMNYAFPTIKRCNPTQSKLYGRVKRINVKVNETLRKICDHCGIKLRVTWGTARSSYISKMIDEGFHPLQVAELAGNSPQTIYRHYYTISDKEKMKKKMNQVF